MDFADFCRVDLQLSRLTVKTHTWQIEKLLRSIGNRVYDVSRSEMRSYLSKFVGGNPNTYANVIKALRIFFRDYLGNPSIMQTFKFPSRPFVYQEIPSKEDLQRFHEGITRIEGRLCFLMYAVTGLRTSELLGITAEDVDINRMIIPRKHQSQTKRTWVTFYNSEVDDLLRSILLLTRVGIPMPGDLFPSARLRNLWIEGFRHSGVRITPTTLHKWFCVEMARLGVQDRYVDAFSGRVPNTIPARHCFDYSPGTLKDIYDKADLTVLF